MVGLVGFILCFPFLNNLPCQGSLKEVLQWVRNVSPQCMSCTGKEFKSFHFIVLSLFLFQLSMSLCLQCWVLEGNAHAVLISLC